MEDEIKGYIDLSDYTGKKKGAKKVYQGACFNSHPALKLGGDLIIYGGSCINPVITSADVYIGFDYAMTFTKRRFPWEVGHEIRFKITDRDIPTNFEDFNKLVEWTIAMIMNGQKVHAGCIGGHGRTGLFFSALVKVMLDQEDATTYVRENYCKKAVESQKQVDWLYDKYGIQKVKPRDPPVLHSTTNSTPVYYKSKQKAGVEIVEPVRVNGSIWGDRI